MAKKLAKPSKSKDKLSYSEEELVLALGELLFNQLDRIVVYDENTKSACAIESVVIKGNSVQLNIHATKSPRTVGPKATGAKSARKAPVKSKAKSKGGSRK